MARPYTVIGFTLFFVTALLFKFEIGVTVIAFAVFAVALVVCLFISKIRKDGFLPAVFASAAVGCALLICETAFVYNPVMAFDGKNNCQIKAEITDIPEMKYGNCYYIANVVSVSGEETDFKARLVFSSPLEAEPYDIVEGEFSFYALGASDEDFLNSYKSDGVFIGAYPNGDNYITASAAECEKPFLKKIVDIRECIKKAVYSVMPDDSGSLAVALLIGDKSSLPHEIYNDFNILGISHVICVSGYHLSLWSMLILMVLKKLRINFRVADLIAAFGVIVFMLIAGFGYSVLRAGIMMLVFLFGDMFFRQRDSLNSLGFALAVLALANPFSMGSVSLQLSALATAGIILYGLCIEPDVNRVIDKIKHKTVSVRLKKLISPLMVTVSATAFTLPVTLCFDGSFNFLCLAANIVAVPLAGLCMVTSAAGALLSLVLPPEYNLSAFVARLFCRVFLRFSSWLADYDFLTFRVSMDTVALIICGIFVFCVVSVIISTFRKPMYSLAAGICAVIFTVSIVSLSVMQSRETRITVLDCGNGTSVLVSCGKENILIGGGGTDFLGASKIKEALDRTKGKLNAVFVPDNKESSDEYLLDVFRVYRPDIICCGELSEDIVLLLGRSEKNDFTDEYATENIIVKSYDIENNFCTYVKTNDISAVICFNPSFDYSKLPDDLRQADVVVSRGNLPFNILNYTDSLCVLNAEVARAEYVRDIYGEELVVTGGDGNVVLRALNGALKVERE